MVVWLRGIYVEVLVNIPMLLRGMKYSYTSTFSSAQLLSACSSYQSQADNVVF